MKKKMIVAAAFIGALLLAGCAPVSKLLRTEEESVPYADYIKISVPAQGGPSRSLTAPQLDSVINHYELIIEEMADGDLSNDDTAGSGTTNAADWYPTGNFQRAAAAPGGTLSMPVRTGIRYQILLLAGYTTDGGNSAVLAKSAWALTDARMSNGQNLIGMTWSPVEVTPDDATPVASGGIPWEFNFSGTPVTPARVTTENAMRADFLRQNDPSFTNANPSINIRLKGMKPLIQAATGKYAFDEAVAAGTPAAVPASFTSPKLYLRALPSSQQGWTVIDKTWNGVAAADATYDYGVNGVTTMTWTDNEIDKTDYPDNNADGALGFALEYYGFKRDAATYTLADGVTTHPAPAFTDTNAQAQHFTKWIIRNGLDDAIDKPNNSGGTVWVMAGTGGGYSPVAGGTPIIVINPGP
ncbi:MAG: hypothetical protein Pg6C_10720 [Treponemataceae bacterium]|nr:MAG: hypothetical protein Pg6C_10720 [Treponemataceae bacterium]